MRNLKTVPAHCSFYAYSPILADWDAVQSVVEGQLVQVSMSFTSACFAAEMRVPVTSY